MTTCEAFTNHKECNKVARWLAEWSDRSMVVCDEHKDYAQECHDGYHDYDQTGVIWMKLTYEECKICGNEITGYDICYTCMLKKETNKNG